MSIATKLGDGGQTSLVGGARLSKADLRVEAYGTVDELNTFLGFARSICTDPEIAAWTEVIQRTLFRVGSALSTTTTRDRIRAGAETQETSQASSGMTQELSSTDVDFLTRLVYQIEAVDGVLADWSLPGAHRESAAYEMCRTVCRRAERQVVRLADSGQAVAAEVIAYLNRLSDLLWLFGRLIERRAGIDARLRETAQPGPKWSRAW
jgi:cob(I)alamin adenosyltransferase